MELSKETLTLIKNFAGINGSLMLKAGNRVGIMNTRTGQVFFRTITDVSEWEGLTIISWRAK